MPQFIHKNDLYKFSLFLVFLCIGCNQKPTQNAVSKQEKETPLAVNQNKNKAKSDHSLFLSGSKSPALIYGANPTYMEFENNSEGWQGKFVEDESLEDPGLVDQTFPINKKGGLEFSKNSENNNSGLYFAKFPTHSKISVCGTTECRQVGNQSLMVIQMNTKQFEELYSKAKEIKPDNIPSKEWNLFFLDQNLKTFQGSESAKLNIGGEKKYILDWNGALDQTGKSELKNIELKWIQLEKPILVGKYKDDENKSMIVIGIESFRFES